MSENSTPRGIRDGWGFAAATVASRALLAFVATLAAMALVPTLFGWSSFVIRTGSMEPRISAGDIVVTSALSPDEPMPLYRVVAFDDRGRTTSEGVSDTLMHRVVSDQHDGTYLTRGDANAANDSTPLVREQVKGRARLLVPWIGLPMLWAQRGMWWAVALVVLVLAAALFVVATPPRWAALPVRGRDGSGDAGDEDCPDSSIDGDAPSGRADTATVEAGSTPPVGRAARSMALFSVLRRRRAVLKATALAVLLVSAAVPLRMAASAFAATISSSGNTWTVGTVVRVPNAPTALVITAGSSQVSLRWTAPSSDGGSPISDYRTRFTTDGGHTWSAPATTGSTAPSTTVTGLTPGTSYFVEVAAANAIGWSNFSLISNAAVPYGVPTAMAAPSAAPANTTQVTVSWAHVVDNSAEAGYAPLTAYTATASPGGARCTVAQGFTSCVVPGLTSGSSYTFTVTATNAAGTSTASAASSVSGPFGAPSRTAAPALSVATGSGVIRASWTDVVNGSAAAGFTTITGNYIVTFSPGGLTCTAVQGIGSCTRSGLTPGTAYTATMTTANAYGTSAASPASAALLAATTPSTMSAPTLSTRPGAGVMRVTWTDVVSGSGAAGYATPALYLATFSNGSSCTAAQGVGFCEVTGLTVGTTYTATIRVTTAAATSSASPASTSVRAIGPPAQMAAPTAVAGSSRVTISWPRVVDSSAAAGYTTITGYTVTATPGGSTCTAAQGTSTRSCSITGLTPGTSYTFSVAATNSAGTSLPSNPSNASVPFTTPSQMTAPALSIGSGTGVIRASWTDVVSGSAAAGYGVPTLYRATFSNGSSCTAAQGIGFCTVTGLTAGTSYTATIAVTTAAGTSTASPASSALVAARPASTMAAPTAVGGVKQATVSWASVTNNSAAAGFTTITSYTVTSDTGGLSCTVPQGSTSCVVAGLTSGITYRFTITATNAAGASTASALSNAVVPG